MQLTQTIRPVPFPKEMPMKVSHYSKIPGKEMNNDMVKDVTGRILIGKEDGAANFCMRRFDLKPGGYAPQTHP